MVESLSLSVYILHIIKQQEHYFPLDFSFFLCFYFDCCRIPLLWYKHFSFFHVKIRLFRFQKPKHLTVSVCDGTKLNKYINKSVCIEAKRVDGIKKRQVNA